MLVDAKGCFLFFGIMPPREPGDVTPLDVAATLGWTSLNANGDSVDEDYDEWTSAMDELGPFGVVMDVLYCDGYPLTHFFAENIVLHSSEEYPLAFDQLPVYNGAQVCSLRALAQELGWAPPKWHLVCEPVE